MPLTESKRRNTTLDVMISMKHKKRCIYSRAAESSHSPPESGRYDLTPMKQNSSPMAIIEKHFKKPALRLKSIESVEEDGRETYNGK